jgi:MFS family permease
MSDRSFSDGNDELSSIQAQITLERVSTVEQIPVQKPRTLSWKNTFTALKHRNYKLWFYGQMISLLGTWMQATAQGFLVFQLTHSPVYLGYVGFAYGIPSWIFMLYGGVLADRIPRRKMLIITQASMMLFAIILAALTFSDLVQAWHIIVLAFLLGVANAFDAPSRQAFVNELVDRKDLTNAIALNATMFNVGTAVGPAVSGITYALFGPAWCFTINGISFIGVIAALLLMKIKNGKPYDNNGKSSFAELKEGLRYVRKHKIIRTLILMVGVVSLFGISFTTLLPAWSVKILNGDATTNGLLQSARGVGALTSALLVASLGRFTFRGKLWTIGSFIFPVMMFVFAFMNWLSLSLLLMVGTGFGLILIFNLANAMVQTLVEDSLRGRVMGIYTFIFFGMMPIGALLMGSLAEKFGEPEAVIIGSIITFISAIAVFFTVPRLREN